MIKRDIDFIIIQHDVNDPAYADGGDSSNRTGIMATFFSPIDMNICRNFHHGKGRFVRHPKQWKYCDPNTDNQKHRFSRDQLLPLISGLSVAGEDKILREALFFRLKRSFFGLFALEQNYDILAPNHIFMLILAARFRWLYWLGPIGYFFHFLNMIWSCFMKPYDEPNQFICECIIYNTEKIYKWLHPDYKKALRDYWDGFPFRDQPEISARIINGLLN